jgi:polar amino acid transport system permease protein
MVERMAQSGFPEILSFGDHGYGDELMLGAWMTLQISFCAYVIGVSIGLAGAMGKLGGNAVTRTILNLYTTLVRASPELILILLLYYAGTGLLNSLLGAYGYSAVHVSGFAAAVAVLAFVEGAYATEVLRAAVQAIPVGQIEAAIAVGMSPRVRFRRIVVPAMIPLAIPGMANLWLEVTKNSSLIAVVGYTELLLATRQAAGNTKLYLLFFSCAALVYLAITLASNQLFKRVEAHYRRGMPKLS